jgi:hypothetical protein
MDVAAEEIVSGTQGRDPVRAVIMPMGGKDAEAVCFQKSVFRQNRKLQYHLIHLGVAVSPDTQQLVFHAVEQRGDGTGVIFLGVVVPGTMIKQVAQENDAVSLFPFGGGQHGAAEIRGAVQVRCDQIFHQDFLLCYNACIIAEQEKKYNLTGIMETIFFWTFAAVRGKINMEYQGHT